ncbi:MAG: metallophosphoesterase [Gemmataceae bacterium]
MSIFRHLAGWIRAEARLERGTKRWARWIGRSWARVSYACRVEPTWLELNQLDIPVPGLPAAFDGFRIVQLTDFHCSRHVNAAYLGEAVELAQAQNADLIALTGDFIHRGFKYVEPAAESLCKLTAPHGVYAVLGNHDYSVRHAYGFRRFPHLHRAVTEALTVRNIRVLQNECLKLERAGSHLQLLGVADLWSKACDLDSAYQEVASTTPVVMLAHNPRTIELLNGRRCDLMLSGHTHGGQVHVPGLGRPTLCKKASRFAAGLYHYRNTHLYVNKGVGFGWRVRYGVRPEVAVLTLRAMAIQT